MPTEKTVSIGFRVTPEFKRLLDIASRREQRTMTNLLEKLLADHCRAAGLLSRADAATPPMEAVLSPAAGRHTTTHKHSKPKRA
jgi:hypothetical protein